MSAAILAFGAIPGLGRGCAAASAGEIDAPARVVLRADEELADSKLARPFCARAALDVEPGEDRATAILRLATADVFAALDERLPAWRQRRVGLALGSSSGGMRSAETLFRALHAGEPVTREVGERATYFAPMQRVFDARFSPATLVLTACAASTLALGVALGWLESGECELVLAGGFDAVSVFVASGFEALRATTARLPSRPFGRDRDGMALGEGAALLALARADSPDAQRRALGFVTGFGASGDAVHVTAPDRTGAGLARAARAALGEHAADIDLVSAHGTATPFNDAAEWKAIVASLGDVAPRAAVHPFKAQLGHTLGAAGALESLAALDALARGVLPAAVMPPEPDPETPARLLQTTARAPVRASLKLSAAFGGANAALVLRGSASPSSRGRDYASAFVAGCAVARAVPALGDLAALTGIPAERLARADELVHLALAAIGGLARAGHELAGAGIVVGHAYATVDVNDRYFERVLERADARAAEPRRFPYTSPNAVAGECSLAYGLTGPNLAVGAGLHGGVEALAIAAHLVRARDADRMIAVAVDAPRRAARAIAASCAWPLPADGAVAILVSRDPGGRRIEAVETGTAGGGEPSAPVGHEALLPLASGEARTASCVSPWGAFARVALAR